MNENRAAHIVSSQDIDRGVKLIREAAVAGQKVVEGQSARPVDDETGQIRDGPAANASRTAAGTNLELAALDACGAGDGIVGSQNLLTWNSCNRGTLPASVPLEKV